MALPQMARSCGNAKPGRRQGDSPKLDGFRKHGGAHRANDFARLFLAPAVGLPTSGSPVPDTAELDCPRNVVAPARLLV
jgi:hypothetical protein